MAPTPRRAGPALAVAGAVAVVVSSFLPWASSGSARRTSYELVRTAERLDLLGGPAATAARSWYLLPLLVSAAWVAAALGRSLLAGTLCAVAGAAAIALVVVVKASPLTADVGMSVSVGAGTVAVAGAALTTWEHRRRR